MLRIHPRERKEQFNTNCVSKSETKRKERNSIGETRTRMSWQIRVERDRRIKTEKGYKRNEDKIIVREGRKRFEAEHS